MYDRGTLDITDNLYDILNVSTLTSVITGGIYKEAEDINDGNENVIIITNGLNSSKKTGVQIGLANINIEIPANTNGTPKVSRFKVLADIIRTLILTNNEIHHKGFYFDIEIEQLFKEMKQNQSYYYNFKLNIQKI